MKQNARDAAMAKGEEISKLHGYEQGPVDPFDIVDSERAMIHLEGDDFGDGFDGRLSYHGNRFLMVYNTRYNAWPSQSGHHPKVRFTVAHELGHYFLDRHREYLVNRSQAIESFTEFESNEEVERQADAFASGLLMPKYLVGPCINNEPDASILSIKKAATAFDVSLTSMMVRWTQLSHFACATLCIRDGSIQWGFRSERFREAGLWRCKRHSPIQSSDAKKFVAVDSACSTFREDVGIGRSNDWLDGDIDPVAVQEFYMVIPYSQCVMVFLNADENDLRPRWGYDD
jgi:IrrE N-terminal-like domain